MSIVPLLRASAFLLALVTAEVSVCSAQTCTGTWVELSASGPSGRGYSAMAYDAFRSKTVLFGGQSNPTTFLNDTWEWDGSQWMQRTSVGAPPARSNHALAYDSRRHVVVLFGGYNGGDLNDTWEYDGAIWVQRSPSVIPTPVRSGHALAYDPSRGVIVLFGGYYSQGAVHGDMNDTWEYDGTNWAQKTVGGSGGPQSRSGHALAFDTNRCKVILFGGAHEGGGDPVDTWIWDGTTWAQLFPATSAGRRANFAMVTDTRRSRLVVTSGTDSAGDTWAWDGNTWSNLQTGLGNPYGYGMAYDIANDRTVLFNGQVTSTLTTAPVVVSSPSSQILVLGHPISFSASASGPAPLAYQWRRDGVPLVEGGRIAGATNATLTINYAQTSDMAAYDCVVSNPCGVARTNPAALVASTCRADFNADGMLTVQDIFDFLAAWFAGCP